MIHVEAVHVVTDGPLSDAQAGALGTAVVREMNAELNARMPAPVLRIGELRLKVPGAARFDRAALTRCARSAVQRILDRALE